jgi:hypothetical protein
MEDRGLALDGGSMKNRASLNGSSTRTGANGIAKPNPKRPEIKSNRKEQTYD